LKDTFYSIFVDSMMDSSKQNVRGKGSSVNMISSNMNQSNSENHSPSHEHLSSLKIQFFKNNIPQATEGQNDS
ncbi:unnamed protein product, partial [Rotaria socialis]